MRFCSYSKNIIGLYNRNINFRSYHHNRLSNDLLTVLSINGDIKAKEERLIRNITKMDDIDRNDATNKFMEIKKYNKNRNYILKLPYYIGISTAFSAGILSFPLCFSPSMVFWFNKKFVTTDIPEPQDLETILEIGSWSWGWMEAPLGQISFFLLCMQFVRSQMFNLNIKPFTELIKNYQSK